MKKTVLSLATLLFASGMAFAGSDRFGSDYIPAAGGYPATHSMVLGGAVDLGVTKSVTDSTAGEIRTPACLRQATARASGDADDKAGRHGRHPGGGRTHRLDLTGCPAHLANLLRPDPANDHADFLDRSDWCGVLP